MAIPGTGPTLPNTPPASTTPPPGTTPGTTPGRRTWREWLHMMLTGGVPGPDGVPVPSGDGAAGPSFHWGGQPGGAYTGPGAIPGWNGGRNYTTYPGITGPSTPPSTPPAGGGTGTVGGWPVGLPADWDTAQLPDWLTTLRRLRGQSIGHPGLPVSANYTPGYGGGGAGGSGGSSATGGTAASGGSSSFGTGSGGGWLSAFFGR